MADYRDLAAALGGGYGQDTGGITPDTLAALKNKARTSDLLGMLKAVGSGTLSNLESLGRGGLSQFLGAPVDTANTIRTPYPMEVFGDVNYTPDKQLPGGSADILGMMPRVTKPTPQAAGMEIMGGFMAPATAKVLKPAVVATGRMIGKEVNAGLTGQPTRSLLGDITPKPLMAVEPQMQMAQAITKPKAEVSPLGFYSAVEQQALNIPRKQGTGASFLNELAKGQDVKKYEMETMGLDEFLKNKPNVTRQEVQDYIANNRINVQEVQLSGKGEKYGVFSEFNPDTNKYHIYSNDARLQGIYNTAEEADAFVNQHNSQIPYGPTKYERYQLPGGENYREILLTLPAAGEDVQKLNKISLQLYGKPYTDIMADTSEMAKMRIAVKREYKSQFGESGLNAEDRAIYRSSHFDEPNILAHMRVNDRVDADGKKMLLIEEVQSDWHQAGRERGYVNQEAKKALEVESKAIAAERNSLVAELSKQEQENGFVSIEGQQRWDKFKEKEDSFKQKSKDFSSQVPDAPFKDTWHQLALKRAIKEAVDKGYDRIGLTTGKQQAERYDLSKQISKIYYSPPDSKQANKFGTVFKAFDSRGHEIINKAVTPEELPGIVGKEVAEKLLDAKGNEMGVKALDGIDLQVGGEGMKKYYDEVYPNYLNKLGKKYGAQVGETQIPTDRSTVDGMPSMYPNKETVRYLNITPEMREAIKEGQPLASIQDELAKALA